MATWSGAIVPHRQIRALYSAETITVYQAYSDDIADAALASQCLTASTSFSTKRMTWIKPSWCWMMYRSGYSYKDPNQARILALRMKHEHFLSLLAQTVVVDGHSVGGLSGEDRRMGVRIQWDPERGVQGERLGWRSVQIGISGDLNKRWAEEWVVGIEDVTGMARELRRVLDEEKEVGLEELVQRRLVPVEREYEVGEGLREVLRMEVGVRGGLHAEGE